MVRRKRRGWLGVTAREWRAVVLAVAAMQADRVITVVVPPVASQVSVLVASYTPGMFGGVELAMFGLLEDADR